jgi:hypothetical protein
LRDWLALHFNCESIVSSAQALYVFRGMCVDAHVAFANLEYDALTCIRPFHGELVVVPVEIV